MKVMKIVMVGLVLLSAAAFAADKGTLSVDTPVLVNGKTLAKGEYKVILETGNGGTSVNIFDGRKIVASSPAHTTDLTEVNRYDSRTVTNESNGSRLLTEVRFAGKKYAIVLDGSEKQGASEASK